VYKICPICEKEYTGKNKTCNPYCGGRLIARTLSYKAHALYVCSECNGFTKNKPLYLDKSNNWWSVCDKCLVEALKVTRGLVTM